MSLTYNPKKRKRQKAHGFRKRSSTGAGKRVMASRRKKQRKKITV